MLNQKIKELQKQNEQGKNNSKFNQNQNMGGSKLNSKKNPSENEILKLKNRINQLEAIILKSNLDKNMFGTKIENLKKEHQNEIKKIINNKDNEIRENQKIINDLKNKLNNNNNLEHNVIKNIYYTKNNKTPKSSYHNYNVDKISQDLKSNNYLKNEIEKLKNNSKYKDTIIKSLREQIHNFSNEYNRQISSLEKNNIQSQSQIEQLFKERDLLMKQNNELTMGINELNDKVKATLIMFNKKNDEFKNTIHYYKNKNNEYKNKIILLKRKIDEINGIYNINKYPKSKDNSVILKSKIKIFNLNNTNKSQRLNRNRNNYLTENNTKSFSKKASNDYKNFSKY